MNLKSLELFPLETIAFRSFICQMLALLVKRASVTMIVTSRNTIPSQADACRESQSSPACRGRLLACSVRRFSFPFPLGAVTLLPYREFRIMTRPQTSLTPNRLAATLRWTTRPQHLVALLLTAALITASVPSAEATLVVTPSTTIGNELAYPVSSTDLINQGQPSLGTVIHTNYNNFSTFSIGGLNDGLIGAATTQSPEATFDLDGSWTSEFNLVTLLPNTLGYTITEIRTNVGWIGDRAGQEFSIEYSQVGSAAFLPLDANPLTVPIDRFALYFTSTGSSSISITDTTGAVLTGVDAIRFTFYDPATGSASVYREIDVFGFEDFIPPAPEPSSALLLGLGCCGMMLRGKRRRDS